MAVAQIQAACGWERWGEVMAGSGAAAGPLGCGGQGDGPGCWPLGLGGHLCPLVLPALTRQWPVPWLICPAACDGATCTPPASLPGPARLLADGDTLALCVGDSWRMGRSLCEDAVCRVCDSQKRVLHTHTHAHIRVSGHPRGPHALLPWLRPVLASQALQRSEKECGPSPGCPSSSQETSGFPLFAHVVVTTPEQPLSRPWSQL